MINKKEKTFRELVDEAKAKMDLAEEVKESNPEQYKKLVDEVGKILDIAGDRIVSKKLL